MIFVVGEGQQPLHPGPHILLNKLELEELGLVIDGIGFNFPSSTHC